MTSHLFWIKICIKMKLIFHLSINTARLFSIFGIKQHQFTCLSLKIRKNKLKWNLHRWLWQGLIDSLLSTAVDPDRQFEIVFYLKFGFVPSVASNCPIQYRHSVSNTIVDIIKMIEFLKPKFWLFLHWRRVIDFNFYRKWAL